MSIGITAFETKPVFESGTKPGSFVLAVLVLFLMSIPVHAIEFSAVKLLSGLNEPLRAEIEVFGLASPGSPLIVDIASPLDHRRYNIPHQFFNADIKTTWHHESDGRVIIRLRSTLPVTRKNLRFLMLVMPSETAMLKEVNILMPDTTKSTRKQIATNQFDFRKSSKAMYGRNIELPALSGDMPHQLFKKKIKPTSKLDQTLKLVKHNEQARTSDRARALAFTSVTDEITYNPHFSPDAIAAVMPGVKPVDKLVAEESAQPVLIAASSNQKKQNEQKTPTVTISHSDEQVTGSNDRMALLATADQTLPDHIVTKPGKPTRWISYTVTDQDSLERLAAGLAKRHGNYSQIWRKRIIQANPQFSMTTKFPPPGTNIKIPFMNRHATLSTMAIYVQTAQAYAILSNRGPPDDWSNHRL